MVSPAEPHSANASAPQCTGTGGIEKGRTLCPKPLLSEGGEPGRFRGGMASRDSASGGQGISGVVALPRCMQRCMEIRSCRRHPSESKGVFHGARGGWLVGGQSLWPQPSLLVKECQLVILSRCSLGAMASVVAHRPAHADVLTCGGTTEVDA